MKTNKAAVMGEGNAPRKPLAKMTEAEWQSEKDALDGVEPNCITRKIHGQGVDLKFKHPVELGDTSEGNAPRDVETEAWAVEAAIKGNLTFGQTREVLAAVTAQRDELLAALKDIQFVLNSYRPENREPNILKLLTAAITKAEGK